MVGIPSFSGGSLGIGRPISGGTDTRLLFNDGGLLEDNAALTFNKTTGVLSADNIVLTNLISAYLLLAREYITVTQSGDDIQISSAGWVGQPTISLKNTGVITWGSGTATNNSTADLYLRRGGPGILAQHNGTNAQESQLYATRVSDTDFHRITTKFAKTTLSGVTGATVTATNLIPAGAILKGLSTKVTTGLGVSGGTSGYQVGDGTDPDRWGAITGTAAGTSSDNRNWTAGGERFFPAANSVVITAVGGNFDGTGVIDIVVAYEMGECD